MHQVKLSGPLLDRFDIKISNDASQIDYFCHTPAIIYGDKRVFV